MFQFNANDLDFEIYRIYNLKRKEIEHFIDGNYENCLIPVIDLTLKGVANFEKKAELASLEAYLKKLNLLDPMKAPEDNYKQLKLFINTNPDLEKKEQLESLNKATEEIDINDDIKDKIYNHNQGYFEIYYSNSDFGYNN